MPGAALFLGSAAHAAEAVVYTSNNVQVIDVAVDIAKNLAPGLNVQRVTSGTGALMKRIEAEVAPKSWKDLFDPKWKNKVIIGDPATSGSAYDQVYGLYKLYGQEELEEGSRGNREISRIGFRGAMRFTRLLPGLEVEFWQFGLIHRLIHTHHQEIDTRQRCWSDAALAQRLIRFGSAEVAVVQSAIAYSRPSRAHTGAPPNRPKIA